MFVNLIVNACDAIVDSGQIVIYEGFPAKNAFSKNLTIKVSDNVRSSCFHRRKALSALFSTKEEGTGLGLSIATRIVEEHGGKIAVESHEGPGATFIITLPATGV